MGNTVTYFNSTITILICLLHNPKIIKIWLLDRVRVHRARSDIAVQLQDTRRFIWKHKKTILQWWQIVAIRYKSPERVSHGNLVITGDKIAKPCLSLPRCKVNTGCLWCLRWFESSWLTLHLTVYVWLITYIYMYSNSLCG